MSADEIREKFLEFFREKGHQVISSASLIPENDPTVLFTTAGMHPLVPYLLGEKHPNGKRLANVQKCIRTGDIDEVGDNRHLTFFEMLGNWSLGDYFKKEAIQWSFEFLTSPRWLGLNPEKIYVTTFEGDKNIPRDAEAIKIWQEEFAQQGIKAEVAGSDKIIQGNIRIIPLGKEDNWWGPAGETGPCGPDTEMFYNLSQEKIEGNFQEITEQGRLVEIWNDVFMEFNKIKENNDFKFVALKQKNVDTGMGLERILTVLEKKENVFETELFQPIIKKIEEISQHQYLENSETIKAMRIIADHLKATIFILSAGVVPSNTERGYILRRLIRRAIRYGQKIGLKNNFAAQIYPPVAEIYQNFYPEIKQKKDFIIEELNREEEKFKKGLEQGLKHLEKLFQEKNQDENKEITGREAFDLYQSYGFPLELTQELVNEKGFQVDQDDFQQEFQKHQEISRRGAEHKFKSGLADHSEMATKYHTTTHLLLASLRQVLGSHVFQKGSNITAERLRFDFSHPQKLTAEETAKVENLVNQKIQEGLPVSWREMSLEEAKKIGAMGVFESRYGEKVKVYTIGNNDNPFSREICAGPHIQNTRELGHFKIIKEKSAGAGIRRIKAILE
ncbi:MAG TPA: alanine--tRNA ligase [Candidatus Portnoybacteria bacterium]|nr:alanine--tRNA ligase [Candidatus Portnoybacteria bacterium]